MFIEIEGFKYIFIIQKRVAIKEPLKELDKPTFVALCDKCGLFSFFITTVIENKCRGPPPSIWNFKLKGGNKMDNTNPIKIIYNDGKYTIEKDEIGKVYSIRWREPGEEQCIEITEEIANAFCEFKRVDDSIKHKYRRHIEHSELTEYTLNKRARDKVVTVEESVIDNRGIIEILNGIDELTYIQKYRFYLYYEGFSLTEIAKMENRAIRSIKDSVDQAKKIIRNFYEKF